MRTNTTVGTLALQIGGKHVALARVKGCRLSDCCELGLLTLRLTIHLALSLNLRWSQ